MQADDTYVPVIGAPYLHQDGGIYRVISVHVLNTTTGTPGVLYEHEWPFKTAMWFRPGEEWTHTRFKQLDNAVAFEMKSGDREAAQAEVTKRKKARKAGK